MDDRLPEWEYLVFGSHSTNGEWSPALQENRHITEYGTYSCDCSPITKEEILDLVDILEKYAVNPEGIFR